MTLRPAEKVSVKGYLAARPSMHSARSSEVSAISSGTTSKGSGTTSFEPMRKLSGSAPGFAAMTAARSAENLRASLYIVSPGLTVTVVYPASQGPSAAMVSGPATASARSEFTL